MASTLGAAAPAYAATPPAAPDNIVIFPDRDFIVLEGYQDRAGQTATISVTRAGVETGRTSGLVDANVDGVALEVNHPGGVCWGAGAGGLAVTPDIQPGDEVTVTFSGGGSDSVVTQSPTVTSSTHLAGTNTLIVDGTLGATVPALAQLEQRIINRDLVGTDVGRRDVRAAGEGATTAYVSTLEFTATTFKATYTFDTASTADIAAEGQMRAMAWMAVEAGPVEASRQGITISELGEVNGPGFGGCPQGPGTVVAATPVHRSWGPPQPGTPRRWSAGRRRAPVPRRSPGTTSGWSTRTRASRSVICGPQRQAQPA